MATAFKGSKDTYGALGAHKRESPAAERNKQPILEVLLEHLPPAPGPPPRPRLILELASGSGQHAAHFAAALPAYTLRPSDATAEMFGSIQAYCAGLPNVLLPPLLLDASRPGWEQALAPAGPGPAGAGGGGAGAAAAVLVINMCHISPLEATRGMLRGAGAALCPAGGLLFVYGPFTRGGRHTSDSNAAFDATLRARDPAWGYRDLDDMAAWAAEAGLEAVQVREMPANNFMLVFRRP